jgi:predicted MPP superfamily phosphohydrolase
MLPTNMKFASDGVQTQGQTVIAQISDLHFSAQTKHNDFEWYALSADLKSLEQKVDLLVVTGDLIDGGFTGIWQKDEASKAFQNVYDYLQKLCKELGLDPEERLVVVPGNHDCRLKGVLKHRVQSENFFEVFRDRYRPVLIRSLGVCVFVLDSNALEKGINLATGLVEKNDLVAFSEFLTELHRNRTEELNSCIKIVLLHHHPMPIAATEGPALLEQPGFLLLKNAGQFMTSMVRSKIDLILHGHQHYPALSKASYPNADGEEHLITIIGAGSVGRKTSNYDRSYNLVTITADREIHSERRVLGGASYERAFRIPIRTFEDARRQAFETLATSAHAKLRVRKFSRVYMIKSGSGDADLYERLEGVTAYSKEVSEYETQVYSISGFFYTPQYESSEGQNIDWIWKPGSFTPPVREARLVFDPPLSKDHPINYESQGKAFNLFYFNQQERRDATDSELGDEFIFLTVQNAIDLVVLTVVFPEGSWPDKFYRRVHNNKCFSKNHDASCIRDLAEEEYFNLRFSKFRYARTIVLTIEKPLPGYTYWVYWTLPPLEEDERELNAIDRGRALSLVAKLLALRQVGNFDSIKVKSWFDNMHNEIMKSKLWTSLSGDDELELSLYVYDSNQRGLVCVATSVGTCWLKVIKSGQSLLGAAYRRREHMLYSPLASHSQGAQLEYEHRVPEDWKAAGGRPYTAICAIPVIYPIAKGCKIGVVTFSTKSRSSRLLNFVPQKSTTPEVKAAGDALVEDVMVRQIQALATAFGVE